MPEGLQAVWSDWMVSQQSSSSCRYQVGIVALLRAPNLLGLSWRGGTVNGRFYEPLPLSFPGGSAVPRSY